MNNKNEQSLKLLNELLKANLWTRFLIGKAFERNNTATGAAYPAV